MSRIPECYAPVFMGMAIAEWFCLDVYFALRTAILGPVSKERDPKERWCK